LKRKGGRSKAGSESKVGGAERTWGAGGGGERTRKNIRPAPLFESRLATGPGKKKGIVEFSDRRSLAH